MTLEELFLEINEAGWRVNNLFQLDDLSWQGNVRCDREDGSFAGEFGLGENPFDALSRAWQKALEGDVEEMGQQEVKVYKGKEIQTGVGKINLLHVLGLQKPIVRRI